MLEPSFSPTMTGYRMETKTLICPRCRKRKVLLRDSHTGMWELSIRFTSISNSSWEYLQRTWLDIHRPQCRQVQEMR
jgi:hypothetical protein